MDYWALNKITIKDKFLISVINDSLDELAGVQYLTKLDLRSSYHQVRVNLEDVGKTAFRTHCNAPKIPYNFYNNFIIYSGYELSETWVFPEKKLINR